MERMSITSQQILDEYRDGRRDFSSVRIIDCNLDDKDLSGIIFRNADLSFGSLRGSKLNNSDFSGAKMIWSDLSKCNMTGANFEGANLEWSALSKATFKDTNFTEANVSNTAMFDVNRGGGNWTNANTSGVWWSSADITLDGVAAALEKLKSMGVPLHIFEIIRKELERLENKWEEHHGISKIGESRLGKFYEGLSTKRKSTALGEYGGDDKGEYSGIKNSEYGSEMIYGALKKRLDKMDEILGKV